MPRNLGRLPLLLILIFAAAVVIPGLIGLPPIDRDESRFAQATKQMLETGDFVRIRFQDEPRNKKPVGIHWLQSASVAALGPLFGSDIWVYRLPSILGFLGAVFMTYRFASRLLGDSTAWLAALMLASTPLAVILGHQATTDAALLAVAVAALGSLAVVYRRTRRKGATGAAWPLAFWAAQGLGLLLKGPVILAISALAVGALCVADRGAVLLRALRPTWGPVLALAIASPWFILINLRSDGDFIAAAVKDDLLPKLLSGQESHGAPPGYYLAMVMLNFWPASLFLWPALADAWRDRADPVVRVLLAWVGPAWVMFEVVPTKLPHYVLPLFPAMAMLTAELVRRAERCAPTSLDRAWPRWFAVPWLLVSMALVVAPPALGYLLGAGPIASALVCSGVAALTAAAGLNYAYCQRFVAAAVAAAIGSGLYMAVLIGHVLPALDSLWLSRDAIAMIAKHRATAAASAVAATGYAEPSLVFSLGTEVRLVEPEVAARFLAQSPDRLALVALREKPAFEQATAALGYRATPLDSVRGFNYSRGQWITLTLYAARP